MASYDLEKCANLSLTPSVRNSYRRILRDVICGRFLIGKRLRRRTLSQFALRLVSGHDASCKTEEPTTANGGMAMGTRQSEQGAT
jgi:hypothetical protein